MNVERMRAFILRQNWIFAKTYADRAPHEYMLLKELVGNKEDYLDFAGMILEQGIKIKFWNVEYRYLYLDDHLYWVMDLTPENTTLINRSHVDDYEFVITPKIERQNHEEVNHALP